MSKLRGKVADESRGTWLESLAAAAALEGMPEKERHGMLILLGARQPAHDCRVACPSARRCA